jgi:hypothetical protein
MKTTRHWPIAHKLGNLRPDAAYLIIPFANSAGSSLREAVSICDSTKNSKFNNLLTTPKAPWHAA